jgi:hypothetical protein
VALADGGDGLAAGGAARVELTAEAVTAGSQNSAPRVHALIDAGAASPDGEWAFTLAPGQIMLLAVAAVHEETPLPAGYTLSVRPAADSR